MTTAYIVPSYRSIEKPFIIEARFSHCGGDEKWDIARISEDSARILFDSGLKWGLSNFDWDAHAAKIERMKAAQDVWDAQERLRAIDAFPARRP